MLPKVRTPPSQHLTPRGSGSNRGQNINRSCTGRDSPSIIAEDEVRLRPEAEGLEATLHSLPAAHVALCHDALSAYSEAIAWMADLRRKDPYVRLFSDDIDSRISSFQKRVLDLRTQLDEQCVRQMSMVKEVLDDVMSVREAVLAEYSQRTPRKSPGRPSSVEVRQRSSPQKVGLFNKIKKAKVNMEQVKTYVLQSQDRVSDLARQIEGLENQLKAKEMSVSYRLKNLSRSNKESGEKLTLLERQRESLELRVSDLKKEKIEIMKRHGVEVQRLKHELSVTMEKLSKEVASRSDLEKKLAASSKREKALENKCNQLMVATKVQVPLTTEVNATTDAQILADLKSTKMKLQEAQKDLEKLRKEKQQILDIMETASKESDKVSQRLGGELVKKVEECARLAEEVARLREAAAAAGDTRLRRMREAAQETPGARGWQARALELQQLHSDQEVAVASLRQRCERLEAELLARQIEVEQRDRVMHDQTYLFRLREEVSNLLSEKQRPANAEQVTALLRKAVVDSNEARETLEGLRSKQQQLLLLQRTITDLKAKLEEADALRAKHEARIADLEEALSQGTEGASFFGF